MEESFFPLSAAFGFSLQSQKKQKEHLPPRSFRCLVSQSLPDARRKKAHDIQPKERMSMFFLLSGVRETQLFGLSVVCLVVVSVSFLFLLALNRKTKGGRQRKETPFRSPVLGACVAARQRLRKKEGGRRPAAGCS